MSDPTDRRLDARTLGLILGAALLGAATAAVALGLAGDARNDATVRPLVWAIFGTPLSTFLGWLLARRGEAGLAAGVCLCVYLFLPFVAARIETLIAPNAPGHSPYFVATIALQAAAGLAIALWRARS